MIFLKKFWTIFVGLIKGLLKLFNRPSPEEREKEKKIRSWLESSCVRPWYEERLSRFNGVTEYLRQSTQKFHGRFALSKRQVLEAGRLIFPYASTVVVDARTQFKFLFNELQTLPSGSLEDEKGEKTPNEMFVEAIVERELDLWREFQNQDEAPESLPADIFDQLFEQLQRKYPSGAIPLIKKGEVLPKNREGALNKEGLAIWFHLVQCVRLMRVYLDKQQANEDEVEPSPPTRPQLTIVRD